MLSHVFMLNANELTAKRNEQLSAENASTAASQGWTLKAPQPHSAPQTAPSRWGNCSGSCSVCTHRPHPGHAVTGWLCSGRKANKYRQRFQRDAGDTAPSLVRIHAFVPPSWTQHEQLDSEKQTRRLSSRILLTNSECAAGFLTGWGEERESFHCYSNLAEEPLLKYCRTATSDEEQVCRALLKQAAVLFYSNRGRSAQFMKQTPPLMHWFVPAGANWGCWSHHRFSDFI